MRIANVFFNCVSGNVIFAIRTLTAKKEKENKNIKRTELKHGVGFTIFKDKIIIQHKHPKITSFSPPKITPSMKEYT